jgi:GDP-L-fucose synthase
MKKLMITGSTGFIGRNLLPMLQENYTVSAPSRLELNLIDTDAVRRYLGAGRFDAVIHLANPTGHNPQDKCEEIFERSLRVFTSLENCCGFYDKMIYIGSGAEYGKHRDISNISEDNFGEELPRDAYGLSRYIMNQITDNRSNIVNLRLFACYGPNDPPHKLIPSIIKCIKEGGDIELNQDVWFDFLYVDDIFPVLVNFIEKPAANKAYNLCSGNRVLISEIADEVRKQMGSSKQIKFKKSGLNLEYTGSNKRLRNEIPMWAPRPISEGIREIIHKEAQVQ